MRLILLVFTIVLLRGCHSQSTDGVTTCTVGKRPAPLPVSWPAFDENTLEARSCRRTDACQVRAHVPRDLRFTPTRYEFECGGPNCAEIEDDHHYRSPEREVSVHGVRASTFLCRLKVDWFVRYWTCCAHGDRSTDTYWLSSAMLAYRPFIIGIKEHEEMPFIPSIAELKSSGQWEEWKANITEVLLQDGGRRRYTAPDVTFLSRARAAWYLLVANAGLVAWLLLVVVGGALVATVFMTHW